MTTPADKLVPRTKPLATMHPRKKESLLAFILVCVMSIGFAILTFLRPNILFFAFLAVSVAGALFGAYRVLCFSDDWYRAQEEREQRWYARHPHLTSLIVILGAGGACGR